MADAPPSNPTPAPGPPRTLTSAELAVLAGVDKRTINAWAQEGCPCGKGTGRGGEGNRFEKSEVAGWLRRQGRIVPVGLEGGGIFAAPSAASTLATSSAAAVSPPATSSSSPSEGTVDLDRMIDSLMRQIESMQAKAPELTDVGALAKWSGSLKDLLGEVRALSSARENSRERSGITIEVSQAMSMAVEMAQIFIAALDRMTSEAPRGVLEQAAVLKVEIPERDGLRKAVSAALKILVADERARLEETILRAGGLPPPPLQAIEGARGAAA